MRKTAVLLLFLCCSLLFASCEAITAQNISHNGSAPGMNGGGQRFNGTNGGNGGAGPGMNVSPGDNGGGGANANPGGGARPNGGRNQNQNNTAP